MLKNSLIALSLSVLAVSAQAQTKTFTIVGEKLAYRNLATFESVSDYETFTGRTNGVSGTIEFDPKTNKGSGKVAVAVKGIDTGIPLRNDHMASEGWLNATKFPEIEFATSKVEHKGGDSYKITGKFTLHGVTKTITTAARVSYKAASPEVKAKGFDGDVLKLTTSFKVKLSDYGVKIPDMAAGKVANEVTVSLTAYGVSK